MQDASRYRPRYCRLPGHLHHLQHKGLVYTQLERLQSEIVPVYLGLGNMDPSLNYTTRLDKKRVSGKKSRSKDARPAG
jgi:hypothetical protein